MEKFCEKLVRYRVPLLILACVVAVAFPFVFPSKYFIRIGTVCLMYVMITLSLNLMVGYMGQMSFGHAAFMGIGAYTAAILTTTYDVPFFVAFILAGVVAGLFGLLLGLPVLKLKGYYFTIITMVFCEIVRVVELNWMSLTRGPLGIMAIPKPSFLGFEITTPRQFYFMILVLVALSTLVVSNLMKSRVGYAILAIRDDELAAEAMGIHVFRYKMIVFILSSLLVGLAGAFYATYTSYIDPSSFAAAQSNDMLVMVIFGGLVALSDISMEVNSGEIVGIIGPNGAGKSTLFNVITGMYNPTEGKVEMLGQDVTGWKPYRITELGFSRTFQNIRLFPRMTVQDNVIVGMHTRTKGNIFSGVFFTKKEKEERASCVREADTILRLLGLYEDRFEMGTSLPYGSQRKLEIARALATRPKLLLLDEPAAGMNEQETEELRQIVYRLKEMGYTILLIEHDMKFVMNICERIYVLNNGCMISSGTPDEVRTDPVVIEAYLGKEE